MSDPLEEVCNAIRRLHGDGAAPSTVRYEPIDPGRMEHYVPAKPLPSEAPEGSQPISIPCFPGDAYQNLTTPSAGLPLYLERPLVSKPADTPGAGLPYW